MNRYTVFIAAGAIVLAACSSTSTPGTPSSPTTQGAGLGGSSAPATTTAPPTSAPPASTPASTSAAAGDVAVCINPVVTCQGELKTEPKTIIVTGDGSEFVTDLVWTGWGLATATGSGTMKIDNCNPNCAQGSFTDYSATVVLSSLTPYTGGAAYATMLVAAAGSPYGTKTYHHLAP